MQTDRSPRLSLARDRRGMAAVEFALISPVLIVVFMGILEMVARFRASEEATRYANQMADLVSREPMLTSAMLEDIEDAAENFLKPLDVTGRLDIDIASIGFEDSGGGVAPELFWRRTSGDLVPLNLSDANGLGLEGESVIRVGVRYDYTSPVSSLFGGADHSMVREAFAKPRRVDQIPIDGDPNPGNTAPI